MALKPSAGTEQTDVTVAYSPRVLWFQRVLLLLRYTGGKAVSLWLGRKREDWWFVAGPVRERNGVVGPSAAGVLSSCARDYRRSAGPGASQLTASPFLVSTLDHWSLRLKRSSLYIGWQWRNFDPYLCQLVFAAILWVKLSEMFATVISLKYAFLAS